MIRKICHASHFHFPVSVTCDILCDKEKAGEKLFENEARTLRASEIVWMNSIFGVVNFVRVNGSKTAQMKWINKYACARINSETGYSRTILPIGRAIFKYLFIFKMTVPQNSTVRPTLTMLLVFEKPIWIHGDRFSRWRATESRTHRNSEFFT